MNGLHCLACWRHNLCCYKNACRVLACFYNIIFCSVAPFITLNRFIFDVCWCLHFCSSKFTVFSPQSSVISLDWLVCVCVCVYQSFHLVDARVRLTLTEAWESLQMYSPRIWDEPVSRRPCGPTFSEDISSRLLISNTSLHLHQIAPRPECSKIDSSPCDTPRPPPPQLPPPPLSPSLFPPAPSILSSFHFSILPSHCLNPAPPGRASTWTIALRLYPAVDTSAHSSVFHILQNLEVNKQTKRNNSAGATLPKSKEDFR